MAEDDRISDPQLTHQNLKSGIQHCGGSSFCGVDCGEAEVPESVDPETIRGGGFRYVIATALAAPK